MYKVATEVLIVLGLIVLNGVFAMAEIALVSARKARLQQRAAEGDSKARIALEIKDNPGTFLSTVQIGITSIGVLAGAFGGATLARQLTPVLEKIPLFSGYAEGLAVAIVVALITFASLVIGELVPKRIALGNPEGIASGVARPMAVLSRIAFPLVWLLDKSTHFIMRFLGIKETIESPVTEEEIRIMIDQGAQTGVLDEVEQQIVERVFRLGDRNVVSVMTPRTEMTWLDVEDSGEANWKKINRSPYSSFPVCRGDIQNIVGLVSLKDLWDARSTNSDIDLAALAKPAVFVPETMPVLRVLERFKQMGLRKALVIDEYGAITGIATLRDILEAMVGDIASDSEDEDPAIVRRPDGSLLVDGMLSIDDLKEALEISLLPGEDTGDFQTLGGFVMSQLGRIPIVSDSWQWDDLHFEVIAMDGHRVDRVLISQKPG